MPAIDWLGKTTDESLKVLVRSVDKFAKFVIKTISKVYEPSTYDKAINNQVYKSRWKKNY